MLYNLIALNIVAILFIKIYLYIYISTQIQIEKIMGSFRSQPDKVKHTSVVEGKDLTYAVSHMCGIYFLI